MKTIYLDIATTHGPNNPCPANRLAALPNGNFQCLDCGLQIMWTTINVVPEAEQVVRLHHAKMVAEGRCIQCRFPWFDGMCSCGRTEPLLDIVLAAMTLTPEERQRLEDELRQEDG